MCGGKVAILPIVKEKRKNSEKRKAKSRDAARCRRSRESEIFTDLSTELPIGPLDKTSVMRIAVGFLKVREMYNKIFPYGTSENHDNAWDSVYAAVMDGFLLILSETGDIVYLSENVDKFIGLSQVDMLGHSLFDFCHPCDHEDVKALLAPLAPDPRSAFVRMRAPLKTRAPQDYQVIRYIGRRMGRPPDDSTFYLGLIGQTISAQLHMPIDRDIFVSRHTLDFKFTYADDRISKWLGFCSRELIGQSLYSFQHAADISSLQPSYKTLFQKGQCETPCYRFLCKHGGWVWVVTQATLIQDSTKPPEGVLCLNYILSQPERADALVSEEQEQKILLPSSTTALYHISEEDMSRDFLNFPDTDILLFQEDGLKDAKELELDLFQCSLPDDPFASLRLSSVDGIAEIPSLDHSDEFAGLDLLPDSPDCYEQDLEFRAPFIPIDDDFPLLSPASSVMWGPQDAKPYRQTHDITDSHSQKLHHLHQSAKNPQDKNSSLAALLQSDTANLKQHRSKQRGQVIMLEGAPYRRQQHRRPHTATVQVRDRLFKVQVSVSELHKPPNPPKRIKLDCSGQRDSVLLNLLISGEDASRGYLCSARNRTSNNKTCLSKEKDGNYRLQGSDGLLVHG